MAGKPRILLHAFSTFNLGGPQARFVQLANTLGSEFRHIVVAMDNGYAAGDRLDAGIQWQPLRLDITKGGALANRGAFRKLLAQQRPDMLLSYNWGAIEWVAANTPAIVPQVHVEDGFGPEEAVAQLPRRVWMRRLLLSMGRVPVVVASRRLEAIARRQWWLPAHRVRFIPNGVAFTATGAAKARGEGDVLTVGTVAGLRPEKNVARLIKAFAALRVRQNARLVIVGDGPQRSALESLATDLAVAADVEFTGYLANPGQRLRDFDLFALSSDTEQLPISLLEAMAAGVPCVATAVGDVVDIVPEIARGAIAAPDDDAFRRVLLETIDHRALWPQWIEAGRRRVREHYAPETMTQLWQALFQGRLDTVFDLGAMTGTTIARALPPGGKA